MLEYLILNNKLEAALKFNESSTKSYKEELLIAFSKGKRNDFLKIFLLLKHESKLQFYLRVYFLIFSIHPSLKAKNTIPEEEIAAFKEYLDTKGADLAKTNEFLEFYALPFVKKPLEHASFKALFKKEWVNNLSEKLNQYIQEEDKRMKNIAGTFANSSKSTQSSRPEPYQEKIREMQQKNRKLFLEVEQFKLKYISLEGNHQSMIDSFNTYMMESQSKWFQITKQLTAGSDSLIEMIIKSNSPLVRNRKFLKIKKKIEKYDKFVKKQLDDLLSQSQDISIFDKPSVNEISSYSVSVAPTHTQRNITTFVSIDEFIPTNYQLLLTDFKKMSLQNKILVLQGLSWRILKSKDNQIRRQTIIGLCVSDVLGVRTGDVMELLLDKHLMYYLLELFLYISEDSYGHKVLFRNGGLYKQIVELIPEVHSSKNYDCLQKILEILQSVSNKKEMKIQLIQLGVIQVCCELIDDLAILQRPTILENLVTVMLNLVTTEIGLGAYETEINIFYKLSEAFKYGNQLVRTLTGGIMFSLLGRQTFFAMAREAKVYDFIEFIIETQEKVNLKQLKMIEEKLLKFEPTNLPNSDEDDAEDNQSVESNLEEEIFQNNEVELSNLEDYIKGHELLNAKYFLKNKEANKQLEEIEKVMSQVKKNKEDRIIEKQNRENKKKVLVNPVVKRETNKSKLPQIKQKNEHQDIFNNQNHPLQQKYNDLQDANIYKSPSFKNMNIKGNSEEKKVLNKFDDHPKVRAFDSNNENSGKAKVNDQFSKLAKNQQTNDPKEKKNLDQNAKKSVEKPEYRIKKSASVEKNIGSTFKKQEVEYESQKNNSLVAEFKNSDPRSPPQKRNREEMLKQLNMELKAELKNEEKEKKRQSKNVSSGNQNVSYERENVHLKKNNFVVPEEQTKAFASRPKLRRTPPKEEN